MSNKVVLGLGGNIGDVKSTMDKSYVLITNYIGQITLKSSLYQTKAWGVERQPDFINQVVFVETIFTPDEILNKCLEIESELGRKRFQKWHERIVDIDILFFNEEIIDTENLKIPHPFIQDRNFVLFPLVEIAPNFTHPILKKTIQKLKNDCRDKLVVTKL